MDPQIKTIVDGLLTYLRQKKLEKLLPRIAAALNDHIGLSGSLAVVSSAVAVSPDKKSAITGILRQKFPEVSRVDFVIDPALQAGISVRIGTRLIDLSLPGRVRSLYEQI